jgi:ATP adenylyltransferase
MKEEKSREILWAPWRIEYILSPDKEDACIFCSRYPKNEDKKNLILYRGETGFVIMNRFPNYEPFPLQQRPFDGGSLSP